MASTNRYRSRSLRLPCRQRLGARSRGGKPRQSRCPHALPACAFVQRIETTGSLRNRMRGVAAHRVAGRAKRRRPNIGSQRFRRTSRSISSSTPPNCAGASNVTTRNSNRRSGSATSRGEDGAASTITQRYASRPMDSWSPSGETIPPSGSCPTRLLKEIAIPKLIAQGLRHCGLNAMFPIRLPPSAEIERCSRQNSVAMPSLRRANLSSG